MIYVNKNQSKMYIKLQDKMYEEKENLNVIVRVEKIKKANRK